MLQTTIQAAIAAGKKILEVYHSDDFQVEMKGDNSPLTKADKKSNEVIMSYLKRFDIPVLSEEMAQADYSERKGWTECWIVDPLDGTKEFIKRNGEFTVNIARVRDGVPVMGVIYTPVSGELFYAEEGKGAFKTTYTGEADQAILEDIDKLATALPDASAKPEKYTVVASRSHRNDETNEFIAKLQDDHPDLELFSRGSSLKICMVAEGKADIYPRFAPTMEWDTAAGHAIAKYAGCKMTLTDMENELKYNKENLLNPWFVVKR